MWLCQVVYVASCRMHGPKIVTCNFKSCALQAKLIRVKNKSKNKENTWTTVFQFANLQQARHFRNLKKKVSTVSENKILYSLHGDLEAFPQL